MKTNTHILLKSLWTQLSNKTEFGTIRWVSLATLCIVANTNQVVQDWFLTARLVKGWNKKKNSDQFPYYFTAAYSNSFLFSSHGTTFQFISLHSIHFLTLSNLLILKLPLTDARFGLRPHFCFRWLVPFTLLPPCFFCFFIKESF